MDLFGLTANLIDACLLIFGKFGKILNARRIRYCFIVEIICLIYWFFMDIERGLYAQGISVIFSIAISIYGWFNWGKKDKEKEEEEIDEEDYD